MALDAFLARAWGDHGDDPAGVAQRLLQQRPALESAAQVAGLARILQHVLAEHLGQWQACHDALQALGAEALVQGDAQAASAVRVALAGLALAQDLRVAAALEPAARIAAHCSASAICSGRENFAGAARHLEVALAQAQSGDADASVFQRPLAVCANNLAWALLGLPERASEVTAQMLSAARAARVWWERAGTWLQVERAEYLLVRVHLAAGQLQQALAHGQACLQGCETNSAPDFELFYAHEAMAQAAAALGDHGLLDQSRDAAIAAQARMTPDDQAVVAADLAQLQAARQPA